MDGKGGLYDGEEEDRMKTVGDFCMHDIIVHGGVFVAPSRSCQASSPLHLDMQVRVCDAMGSCGVCSCLYRTD